VGPVHLPKATSLQMRTPRDTARYLRGRWANPNIVRRRPTGRCPLATCRNLTLPRYRQCRLTLVAIIISLAQGSPTTKSLPRSATRVLDEPRPERRRHFFMVAGIFAKLRLALAWLAKFWQVVDRWSSRHAAYQHADLESLRAYNHDCLHNQTWSRL
jgi:hypothetical protein